MKTLWLWSKISTVKWEEEWEERLRFLPPGHLSLTTSPGSRALRIRAYVNEKTALDLKRAFGGSVRELPESAYNKELERELRPLHVRGKIVVVSSDALYKRILQTHPLRTILHIPASMAFGTGSHPTTAGCLRLLCDESEGLGQPWSHLDLGTGSGILAIAARRLGAKPVIAMDYDAVCVRHTRANAKLNGVRLDAIEKADVLHWKAPGQFRIVTANLFSNTLIAAAENLVSMLEPGGALIFSGVLRAQFSEVERALAQYGVLVETYNRRGKWVCGLARASVESL
jgi:ribosomal protein L11 methyltransferase